MTLLDDRPIQRSAPRQPERSSVPSAARWRLAARLARREVRRRPGRTALVTLLVAVPVMGMVLGSVLGRTQADSWAERFQRTAGQADVRLELWSGATRPLPVDPGTAPEPDTADTGPTDEQLAGMLPAGSTLERYGRVYAAAQSGEHARFVQFLDLDLDSPLLSGSIEVLDGVPPTTVDEIALDQRTADQFGVSIGDTLRLTSPAGAWTVTALVRNPSSFRDPLAVFGTFDWDRVAPEQRGEVVSIDLPAGTTPEQTAALVTALQAYGGATARDAPPAWPFQPDDEVSTEAIAWGWVAGALALCVVGIIIASAFATSARRQLVTIGQLSANGADRQLLRRTLALQGSWSGLIGSVVGVGLGLFALFAFRDLAEFVVSRRLGSYEIAPGDLVIIVLTGVLAATVAALVPARGTSRVPVMAALAGRRPLGVVPRRLVPIGLTLFGGGLFLLVLATTGSGHAADDGSGSLYAATAVLGGLGVLFGMCCVTPLAVDLVGRAGARVSGSWRLSARSLARTRTRSAGVVTAIAAAGALAAAGSTLVASSEVERFEVGAVSSIPLDTVRVSAIEITLDEGGLSAGDTVDQPVYVPQPVSDALVDRVVEITGGDVQPRRAAVWDPAPYLESRYGVSSGGLPMDMTGVMAIADPDLLDMIGLSDADRARLGEVGAMMLVSGMFGADAGPSSQLAIDIERVGEKTLAFTTPVDPIESQAAVWGMLVTEDLARSLGLDIVDDGVAVRADHDLSTPQLRELLDVQRGADVNAYLGPPVFDAPTPSESDSFTQVSIQLPRYPAGDVPTGLLQLAIAGAALLFTLFIVAIGLALSAAESRDERDVLMAIGAKPRTLRRVAAQKAALLSLAGTVLAVPTGLLPVVVVLRSIDGWQKIVVSWPTMLLLVVGVPLLAGVVTWLGSSAAQRLRPVRMSTLHTD